MATFLEGNATKKTLLEPILGLGVSYKFVKAAQTAAERRARVATLAAFLSASTGAVFGSSTAANGSAGAVVASHIAHMRNVLEMRGGSLLGSGVKGSKIVLNSVNYHYGTEFTYNSKMIIENMFEEHTTHRYLQASVQKIKTVAPNYLVPMASASTKVNTIALIGWTFLGLG